MLQLSIMRRWKFDNKPRELKEVLLNFFYLKNQNITNLILISLAKNYGHKNKTTNITLEFDTNIYLLKVLCFYNWELKYFCLKWNWILWKIIDNRIVIFPLHNIVVLKILKPEFCECSKTCSSYVAWKFTKFKLFLLVFFPYLILIKVRLCFS